MAEEVKEDNVEENKKSPETPGEETQGSSKAKFIVWGILAAVILVGFGGGYGAARIFAAPESAIEEVVEEPEEEPLIEETATEEVSNWEFEIPPVIANLDEPGVTRYVRATLILRISNEVPEAEYGLVLAGKESELVDWLYLYMASLNLEDVQGARNLERFKLEIQKNFNEMLFPDSKPMIKRILTKEFQIQ